MRPPSGAVFVEVSPGIEILYVTTCLCKSSFPDNMATLDYEEFRNVFSVLIQGDSFNCVEVIQSFPYKENPYMLFFFRSQSLEGFEIGYCCCCFH